MRFAAGITISGIISLIVLELVKVIAPTLKGLVIGVLTVALKVILVMAVLLLAVTVIAVGLFFYNRGKKVGAEA